MTARTCQEEYWQIVVINQTNRQRNYLIKKSILNSWYNNPILNPMHRKKRKRIFLITSLISLIGLTAIILFLPPTFAISLPFLSLPIFWLTFILIFFFLYSLTAFVFRSFIHGILVGLFPITYLVLRLNDVTGPIFFILLLGLFVAMEKARLVFHV